MLTLPQPTASQCTEATGEMTQRVNKCLMCFVSTTTTTLLPTMSSFCDLVGFAVRKTKDVHLSLSSPTSATMTPFSASS